MSQDIIGDYTLYSTTYDTPMDLTSRPTAHAGAQRSLAALPYVAIYQTGLILRPESSHHAPSRVVIAYPNDQRVADAQIDSGRAHGITPERGGGKRGVHPKRAGIEAWAQNVALWRRINIEMRKAVTVQNSDHFRSLGPDDARADKNSEMAVDEPEVEKLFAEYLIFPEDDVLEKREMEKTDAVTNVVRRLRDDPLEPSIIARRPSSPSIFTIC